MDQTTVTTTAADGSIRHYYSPDRLTFFDMIRLADSAAKRAANHVADGERFGREYETARHWCSAAYRIR